MLAVEQTTSHHLDLQLAGGLPRGLPRDLQFTWKLVLQLLLQLSELGGVTSSPARTRRPEY